jgi:hypothetical protein
MSPLDEVAATDHALSGSRADRISAHMPRTPWQRLHSAEDAIREAEYRRSRAAEVLIAQEQWTRDLVPLREWAEHNSRRDELVRAAAEAGVPETWIAEASGLARTTVRRILGH